MAAIVYFPYSLPGSNVAMALVARGSQVAFANSTVSPPLAFGADFGLALLEGSISLASQIGFTINSVKIEGNNTTYQGKVLSVKEVSSGTTAFANNW
ncbi:MAG: hypothetical protein QW812_02500 [Thermoplasmataceae archaeon]